MDQTPKNIAGIYSRDGYCFPIDVMNANRALHYRKELETVEAATDAATKDRQIWFTNANFVLPFVDEITRLPSVLEPVKQIIGPNLLVWNCSFFTKEPGTPNHVSWHQDLTYWGLNDTDEVTAWVALSAATVESGCMRFIARSHKQDIVAHTDSFDEINMLSRGQEIAIEVDEASAVDVVLRPGQMSLHHGHIFHASGPNQSSDRRIGLAIRYITPAMKQRHGEKPYAHLVSGRDEIGNFHLLPPPSGTMLETDIRLSERNIRIQEKFFYDGAEQTGRRLR